MKQLKDRYDINNIQDNDVDGYGIIKKKSRLETLDIDMCSLEFDGVNHKDAPDYCDAFIVAASFTDGTDLTDAELDELNEDSSFVYEALQDHLH